jgi:hypothetical protein
VSDTPEIDAAQEHAAGLRRASDEFMSKLDRLHDLETRKRELPPDQAEFVRLAREIEDLARGLLYAGGQQVELAEELHHEAKAGVPTIGQPIRETPPRRDAVAILAAPLNSEEERVARADVERLRAEYRAITTPRA